MHVSRLLLSGIRKYLCRLIFLLPAGSGLLNRRECYNEVITDPKKRKYKELSKSLFSFIT